MVPGKLVDSSTTRAPGRRWGAIARPVSSTQERSGSRLGLSGVGTQMTIADASATRDQSPEAKKRREATADWMAGEGMCRM